MEEGVLECIPKKSSHHRKPGKPLWISPKTLSKVKKKTEAYKRYLNTREGADYIEYCKSRNQARWECRKAKRSLNMS
jgi:hypothetical protein